MLKEERHEYILSEIKKNGIVTVADLTNALDVTEMTIRRDLKELDELNLIKRIHGGAKDIESLSLKEISHNEKKVINIPQKDHIARIIADMIEDGDTVYLGTGTTIERVGTYLENKHCTIVTNSYYLFDVVRNMDNLKIILTGGQYRSNTGAFVGTFASSMVEGCRFKKAFVGVNGINDNNIFTSNELESEIQKIALDNSVSKYIAADTTKIGKEDFLAFYNVDEIDAIITDENISKQQYEALSELTKIIN